MVTYKLDGRRLYNREALHEVFAETLDFPPYYGRNLDALYDCLTEIHQDCHIEIVHWRSASTALGNYADRLLALLSRICRENPYIALQISSDEGPENSEELI